MGDKPSGTWGVETCPLFEIFKRSVDNTDREAISSHGLPKYRVGDTVQEGNQEPFIVGCILFFSAMKMWGYQVPNSNLYIAETSLKLTKR